MSVATPTTTIRLGTRGSMLARTQSQIIADALEKRHRGLKVELIICKTTGDRIQDRPLHEAGGKGLFTKELEEALLAGSIDFAVHSFKDVPVTMPLVEQGGLVIAAVPAREDVRDVVASKKGRTIDSLLAGARVGTGSLRRRCQITVLRPDLKVELIRGNIDTRLRKLHEGQYDAVVLAMAGMKRSGLFDADQMSPIPLDQMLPAAAQGALAIQCRKDDSRTRTLLGALDDRITHQCVSLERAIVQALDGDCHSPIAALATVKDGQVTLRAAVGRRGGEPPVIHAQATAELAQGARAVDQVMAQLEQQNAREMLAEK